MIQELKTKAEFDAFVKDNVNVAIDFYADWCGPCKQISPKFVNLSEEYLHVKFAKVNVDVNEEAAEACEISAMPTFLFFKDGKKVADFKGANVGKLTETLDEQFPK